MDKDHIQLLLIGLFGIFGFLLFLVLLMFFQQGLEDQEKRNGISSSENSFIKKRSRSLTAERSALVVPSILREFSFSQLETATGKFSGFNLMKAGHSGDIFSGLLEGGELVVIKRFQPSKSERDFYQAEMDIYGRVLDQRFLVPLLGQCLEDGEKLLVYQYMPHGDLATALANTRTSAEADDDDEVTIHVLPWITRLKIARGVAEALAYLHHESRPRLAHRNIQGNSVLLTESFEVRLGSLSEAQKLDGGALPAYDIYCFGKLLLDLISGLDVSGSTDPEAESWMLKCLPLLSFQHKEHLMKIIDRSLILDDDQLKEVMAVAQLAKACMDPTTLQQLSMKKVFELLKNPQG